MMDISTRQQSNNVTNSDDLERGLLLLSSKKITTATSTKITGIVVWLSGDLRKREIGQTKLRGFATSAVVANTKEGKKEQKTQKKTTDDQEKIQKSFVCWQHKIG